MDNKKICIIACGQLTTNPRALKELRALKESGYDAYFIGSYCINWALKYDALLQAKYGLAVKTINWAKSRNPLLFYKSRLRYFIARKLYYRPGFYFLRKYAFYSLYPEIEKEALRQRADLYIAHNLSALPAAYAAARQYKAKLGFDAEDFHSAELLSRKTDKKAAKALNYVDYIEKKYLPSCDYISAASRPIALAYAKKYRIAKPIVLLNVFPFPAVNPPALASPRGEELSLYWFSQTIGKDRGLEEVVQAMGRVRADVALYLQGNIREDYRRELLRLAARHNIKEDKIIFLAPSFPDDLANIASSFDIGLALERREPLNRDLCVANKLFIYLLAGLSIIATRTQGQSGIIESIGEAGWLYDCGDIDALAGRIDYLAFNRGQLEESKKEALRYAHEKYNWDIEKNKFLSVVAKVLE